MSPFEAVVLGTIEGFTEFLPISSTAHLILTSHLLSLQQTDGHILFEIMIQLGAICAVVLLFFKKLLSFPRWQKLALAFVPTGLAGFLIYPYIKIIFNTPILIGFTLLLGGIIILFAEHKYGKAELEGEVHARHEITFKEALLLGFYQAIAIIPGVSRSGAIIVGGLFHKIERRVLTEFTFLLAVPTMVVATSYSLFKKRELFLVEQYEALPFVLGFLASFLIASLVIKFLLDYIKKHSFTVFGFYRIVLGIIVIVVFL